MTAESAYDGFKVEKLLPTLDRADGVQNQWLFYEPATDIAGYEKLMLAVLEDAVVEYIGLTGLKQKTRWQKSELSHLRYWFKDRNWDYLYSFATICDHFRLDPSWLSEIILDHTAEIRATYISKGRRRSKIFMNLDRGEIG